MTGTLLQELPLFVQQLRCPLSRHNCAVSIQTRQKQIQETKGNIFQQKTTTNQWAWQTLKSSKPWTTKQLHYLHNFKPKLGRKNIHTLTFPPTQKTSMSFTRTIWLVTLSSFTATPWQLVRKNPPGSWQWKWLLLESGGIRWWFVVKMAGIQYIT